MLKPKAITVTLHLHENSHWFLHSQAHLLLLPWWLRLLNSKRITQRHINDAFKSQTQSSIVDWLIVCVSIQKGYEENTCLFLPCHTKRNTIRLWVHSKLPSCWTLKIYWNPVLTAASLLPIFNHQPSHFQGFYIALSNADSCTINENHRALDEHYWRIDLVIS